MLLPGTLVVYAKDLRHVCAANLYVVLGKARADKNSGKPQLKIHSICTMGGTASSWAAMTRKPIMALVSDLTPISAWGISIENITTVVLANGNEIHRITLTRKQFVVDGMSLRKWGRQFGAVWDWMLTAEIRKTEHAELIKKRMIADYLGEDAEAAA